MTEPRAFSPEDTARLRALPCRGVFEAHLTVDGDRETFEALCHELGVDCVWIQLARGEHPSQPMTASHHRGELASVIDEVEQLYARLREAGFAVVRVKLEAMVTNAGVPAADGEAAGYFEIHAKVRIPPEADTAALRSLCERHGAHLSRNDRSRGVRFVTMRAYRVGRPRAEEQFRALVDALGAAGHTVVGTTTEYTIHDGRLELDAGWL